MNDINLKNLAPELEITDWLNSIHPFKISELKGKVVVVHAFQMLCPGCVAHGIPQASAIHRLYNNESVQVIGLHTVFEHHEVMTLDALTAFTFEYQLPFPVAVDTPSTIGSIPLTMGKYQMQGTPTLIIIDKFGQIRLNHFGRISDLQVGSLIGSLLAENADLSLIDEKDRFLKTSNATACGDFGCLT